MAHPGLAKATEHITSDRIRATLMDMVGISSPTGREAEMAEYLVGRMAAVGLETGLQMVDAGPMPSVTFEGRVGAAISCSQAIWTPHTPARNGIWMG